MKKNMGAGDRIIRIIIGAVVIALIAMGTLGGVPAIVLGIIAAVMILTAVMGWCPAYIPFKFSTCKNELPPA